jgi:hypothetical protein
MADPPVVVPVNFATASWTARDPIPGTPPPVVVPVWGAAGGVIAYPTTVGQIWPRGKR